MLVSAPKPSSVDPRKYPDRKASRLEVGFLAHSVVEILAANLLFGAGLAVFAVFLTVKLVPPLEREVAWDLGDEIARRLPPLSELRTESTPPTLVDELALANPETELFITDQFGSIVYPAELSGSGISLKADIDGQQVDDVNEVPVLGTDPRNSTRTVPIVIAPLVHIRDRASDSGYVYLVIRSRFLRVLSKLRGKYWLAETLFTRFLPWFFLSFLLCVGFAWFMGRQFRRILALVDAYAAGDLTAKWGSGGESDVDRLAERIEHIAQTAVQAEQYAQQSDVQRRSFLVELAHDLRGPLAGASASIEVLGREASPRRAAALVKPLRSAVSTLRSLAQALGFADLDSALGEEIRMEEIDADAVARNVVGQIATRADKMGISVFVSHEQRPALVHADPRALERILFNLADNALRHTRTGGSVSVELAEHPAGVEIAVRDTGVGIPRNELDRIFMPFFRGTNNDQSGGAGLGLSLVRRLLELHQSIISVESEVGKGTRFLFMLPRSAIARPPTPSQETAERVWPRLRLPHWLAVELLLLGNAVLLPWLVPHSVSALSIMAFTFIGFVGGMIARSDRSRTFTTVCLSTLVAESVFWMTRTPAPSLILAPLLFGPIFGWRYAAFVRSAGGIQLFKRAAVFGTVVSALGVGWAGFVFHVTVEEEIGRHSQPDDDRYVRSLAAFGAGRWCAEHLAANAPERLTTAASFADLRALNFKEDIHLLSGSGEVVLGSSVRVSRFVERVIWGHFDLHSAERDFFRRVLSSPRYPFIVGAPVSGCVVPTEIFVIFRSELLKTLLQNALHSADLKLYLFGAMLAIPFALRVSRNQLSFLDRSIVELRTAVEHLGRDPFVAPPGALGFPLDVVVQSVAGMLQRSRASLDRARASDEEIRRIGYLAGREYLRVAEMLERFTGRIEALVEGAADDDFAAAHQLIRQTHQVLIPEIALTQGLFELGQTLVREKSYPTAPVDLGELVGDVIADLLGFCASYSIVISSGIEDDEIFVIHAGLFRLMLVALLHSVVSAASSDTSVRAALTKTRDESRLAVTFRSRVAIEPSLGSVISELLAIGMGFGFELESFPDGLCHVGITLPAASPATPSP